MDHSKLCKNTLNTTRIYGIDPIDTSIEISKIGFSSINPNAVILINKNEIFDGIAATPLVHHPINAPILLTDGKTLTKEIILEIHRLSSSGHNRIPIYLVGKVSKYIENLLTTLAFSTHTISGKNHYETACKIFEVKEDFENILIISGEDFSEGLITTFWSAHHGDPILFVQRDRIPECTLRSIENTHDINIYIVGSTKTISETVEIDLSKIPSINKIVRINGNDPYEIAVNFAKYKDSDTKFGWARDYEEGHAFTFSTLYNSIDIIPAAILAHMGKHTPLLLTEKDSLPKVLSNYIESIKPIPSKDMPSPPFMHGFILGNEMAIPYSTQVDIDKILSIDHEMMTMIKMDSMNHDKKMPHDEHHKMKMHHKHNKNHIDSMSDRNNQDYSSSNYRIVSREELFE